MPSLVHIAPPADEAAGVRIVIDAGRCADYVLSFPRERRVAALAALEDAYWITPRVYWPVVRAMWLDADRLWRDRAGWLDLFRRRDEPERLSTRIAHQVRRDAGRTLEVFRGHAHPDQKEAFAWTVCPLRARDYAIRYRRPGGNAYVDRGLVRTIDVFAIVGRRRARPDVIIPTPGLIRDVLTQSVP